MKLVREDHVRISWRPAHFELPESSKTGKLLRDIRRLAGKLRCELVNCHRDLADGPGWEQRPHGEDSPLHGKRQAGYRRERQQSKVPVLEVVLRVVGHVRTRVSRFVLADGRCTAVLGVSLTAEVRLLVGLVEVERGVQVHLAQPLSRTHRRERGRADGLCRRHCAWAGGWDLRRLPPPGIQRVSRSRGGGVGT